MNRAEKRRNKKLSGQGFKKTKPTSAEQKQALPIHQALETASKVRICLIATPFQ